MKIQTLLLLVVFCTVFSLVISAPSGDRNQRKKNKKRKDTTTTPAPSISPTAYLEKYGYLIKGVQHSPRSEESALIIFQEFAGLEPTGILDEPTIEKMLASRCGVEDILGSARMGNLQKIKTNGTSRFRRYNTRGSKWSKNNLTYHFNGYTPDLTRAEIRNAVSDAFQMWADASPLTFRESSDTNADILIDFAAGVHSDGYGAAFDGPGGTLAHAYFPENGDAHFDEDEDFTVGTADGINLYIVAAHEFGHSLGLSHSADQSALMYPWYLGYVENYQLPQDDINGIQQLYGRPDVERDPTTGGGGSTVGGGGNSNLPTCDSEWDSATFYGPDDVVYAFKGQYIWAIDDNGIVNGYPKKTKKVFTGAPSGIHAVVSSGQRTYMFKGKKIWRFYDKRLESGFPQAKPDGLPSTPDAALLWGGNGKIYIFKGSRFYEFLEYDMSIGPPMKISQQWYGIPGKLHAALQWRNGKTYFFKADKYWRFNDGKMTTAKGYPKSKSTYWMGCGVPDGQDLPAKVVLPPSEEITEPEG